jgi:hypothetical protein
MTAADVVGRIGDALTPVVMITVTALAANGMSTKHSQLGSLMRSMTAELRDGATRDHRRRSILAQLRYFHLRLRLAHAAHVLIYVASLVFVLLVILLTLERAHGLGDALLFVVGLVCLFGAIALVIIELAIANRTMTLELNDTVGQPAPTPPPNRVREPQPSHAGAQVRP